MNGADATRAILSERPRPIVMLSAHTRQGAVETMEALTAGAVDFVPKPAGEVSASLSAVRETLLSKLALVASANLAPATRIDGSKRPRPAAGSAPRHARPTGAVPAGPRVLVLASSTGGPAALVRVLSQLKLAKKAAVILVQHMPQGFTEALALQLAERASFPVREARAGDRLEPGVALLAPGGTHLVVERSGAVALRDGPPVHGVKPAADVTLRSVAEVYGARSRSRAHGHGPGRRARARGHQSCRRTNRRARQGELDRVRNASRRARARRCRGRRRARPHGFLPVSTLN